MKAIERHCGIFQGNEISTIRRFADFPAGDAIPNDILLLSDAQYAQRRCCAREVRLRPTRSVGRDRMVPSAAPR